MCLRRGMRLDNAGTAGPGACDSPSLSSPFLVTYTYLRAFVGERYLIHLVPLASPIIRIIGIAPFQIVSILLALISNLLPSLGRVHQNM